MREWLKQARDLFLRHPDSRIDDIKTNVVVALLFNVADDESNAADLGELDRIADQVDDDLSKSFFVAVDERGNGPREFDGEVEIFFGRSTEHHGVNFIDQSMDREWLTNNLELAGFDLR